MPAEQFLVIKQTNKYCSTSVTERDNVSGNPENLKLPLQFFVWLMSTFFWYWACFAFATPDGHN
jgi:hypothetical protein